MKITKSTLIQMIKEEMRNEDDDPVDIPTGELEPQSTGMTLKGDVDLKALTQILKDALDAYDSDEPASVYSVVAGLSRALELLEPEETIEVTGEEEDVPPGDVTDLRGIHGRMQDPMGRGDKISALRAKYKRND
jgi:hypothetical protein